MTSIALLTGSHQRTYRTILQHPVSHNLAWRDVHALFRHLGQVEEEPNGNLKVTRNGQVIVLHVPLTKDVATVDELMALRHFLAQSTTPASTVNGQGAHWLVVIDHREARIYRSVEPGALPQLIRPHAPDEFFRQMPNAKDFSRGREKPNPNSFFEPVAGVLNGAGKILVFGSGTGTSSEMNQFIAWLNHKRPALALRIIGAEVVDAHHLTEEELLAQARASFAAAGILTR
jgi:hypothetical protein